MGSPDRLTDVVGTEGPEEADALRWAEDDVVARSGLGRRPSFVEEPLDFGRCDAPRFPAVRAGADLAAEEVLLRPGSRTAAFGGLDGELVVHALAGGEELTHALLRDAEATGDLHRVERRSPGGRSASWLGSTGRGPGG